eukprot:359266-Chlamydomonas_euryale.AAC.1
MLSKTVHLSAVRVRPRRRRRPTWQSGSPHGASSGDAVPMAVTAMAAPLHPQQAPYARCVPTGFARRRSGESGEDGAGRGGLAAPVRTRIGGAAARVGPASATSKSVAASARSSAFVAACNKRAIVQLGCAPVQ